MSVTASLSFGTLLKRHRRAARLTQAELAERAGYSTSYISMLERGERLAQRAMVERHPHHVGWCRASAHASAPPATEQMSVGAMGTPPSPPGVAPLPIGGFLAALPERACERYTAALVILNRLGERLYAEHIERALAELPG